MSTMGIIQRGSNSVMVELPCDQTTRLIERALRMRATFEVTLKQAGAMPVTGELARADGDVLVLVGPAGLADATLPSVYCDVAFRLDGEEFHFTTVILATVVQDDHLRLELSYPPRVMTWQRRRFVRAAVADSAAVIVRGTGGAPGEGRILNVSRDGLAFRIPTDRVAERAVGEPLELSFTLSADAGEFHLAGTVISKTPGGTPGTVIVGVQFIDDPATQATRDRLASALKAFM
jgi:Tfp pilus assembly protein PilZ